VVVPFTVVSITSAPAALEVGGVDTVRFAGWFYRKIARVPGLEGKVLSALNSGGFATLVELLTVYRMDEQVAEQPEPFVYEQMYQYLYDYHFGRITFLELLEKWKAVLDLPTDNPAANSSAA